MTSFYALMEPLLPCNFSVTHIKPLIKRGSMHQRRFIVIILMYDQFLQSYGKKNQENRWRKTPENDIYNKIVGHI